MKYKTPPKKQLGFFPTPLVDLPGLSERMGGPRILMKRDDQTGLALGGNKTRKLEYLVGDALTKGCDTLVTGGAAQSNHCRQTAAAAASCGLDCHLSLGGFKPECPDGNLLLDLLLGARIHWGGENRKGEAMPSIVEGLTKQGRKPYLIPYGGSSPIGAVGFVDAAAELQRQLKGMDTVVTHIVFASSSGGTHAGLMVGSRIFNLDAGLIGIGIDKGEAGDLPFNEHVLALADGTGTMLEAETSFQSEDVIVNDDYLGAGYGVVGQLERKAIRLTAETEGILLDPVYTGRAMGGFLDMIEKGVFSQKDTVLFWHTGGTPALFPNSSQLLTQ